MNGAFRVVYSVAVQTALEELLSRARQADRELGRGALAAVEAIDESLRTQPRTFGEPRYRLRHLQLEVRVAVSSPLIVSFAVHETQDIVFVMGYHLVPRTRQG
jgi:hypothetical protein